ncbi:hypothetical protein D9M69_550190 [compost metagenome]
MQAGGECPDLSRQLSITGLARLPCLALCHYGNSLRQPRIICLGQNALNPVQLSAREPGREFLPPSFIEIAFERFLPGYVAVLHDHSPVTLWLSDGAGIKLVIVIRPHTLHQFSHAGGGDVRSAGLPRGERAVLHFVFRIQIDFRSKDNPEGCSHAHVGPLNIFVLGQFSGWSFGND